MRSALISKGQPRQSCPLNIPCLRDRVAQKAATHVLATLLRADLRPEVFLSSWASCGGCHPAHAPAWKHRAAGDHGWGPVELLRGDLARGTAPAGGAAREGRVPGGVGKAMVGYTLRMPPLRTRLHHSPTDRDYAPTRPAVLSLESHPRSARTMTKLRTYRVGNRRGDGETAQPSAVCTTVRSQDRFLSPAAVQPAPVSEDCALLPKFAKRCVSAPAWP